MRNLAAMMQKAKTLQDDFASMKAELTEMRFTAESGSGAVRAEVNGNGMVMGITIGTDIIGMQTAGDVAILEDLIQLAVNDAQKQATSEKEKLTRELTDGLPLPPGFNLSL